MRKAHDEGRKDITLKDVKIFLKAQEAHTRIIPKRKKFPRNVIIASLREPGHIVQADIMDNNRVKKFNQNIRYLLLVQDTYSKYLAMEPLKGKSKKVVIECFKRIMDRLPFKIQNIYWDREGSFMSDAMKEFLDSHNIGNYTTKDIVKAPGVERNIRTVRGHMYKMLMKYSNHRWLENVHKFEQITSCW